MTTSTIRRQSLLGSVFPGRAWEQAGDLSYAWVLLLSIGVLLALAGPFLAGKVYTADDLGAFHLPMRAFYANCLARGVAFDWSPQMYCGFYLTGEGQIGAYHPLHLLIYRILPLGSAFDIECLMSYPFMLLGVYLLLRRWDIRRGAALFGGLTFTFSGFSLLHFVHVNGVAVVAHVPWLLLAIHTTICGSSHGLRRTGGIGIALLTGSQLLLGYPQYVWLSMLAELGYLTLLLCSDGTASIQRKLRVPWTIGLWKAIGILLGAVQLLPTLDALQHSSREAADSGFSGWGSLDPLNLVQLVAPYLFQTRVVGQNTHELGLYVGSVTLVLAIWCIANRPANARLRLLTRGAIVLVVVGLLLAFGDQGPLQWFISHLPLLNRFRFPCRAIVLVHLGMAVLATIGLVSLAHSRNQMINRAPKRPYGVIWLWSIVALSVILAVAGPFWWSDYVATPMLIWTGPILLALAALLAMVAQRRGPCALAGLMLLSAIDLGAYGMSYGVYPRTTDFNQYIASIAVPPDFARKRVALDLTAVNHPGLRAGNQLLLTGRTRVDGYAGLEPVRQLDYRQIAALRVAGVGWISDRADVVDRDALKDAVGGWLKTENPLPRARLVTQAMMSTDPARDITRIHLESTALVEQPIDLQPGRAGAVAILADQPGDIRLAVDAPGRQLLVVAESFHTGWEVTAGGEPRTIVRVNGDFMGCLVEPGTSEIHLRFRPASLRYGMMLSFLGLSFIAVAAMLWLCGRVPSARPKRAPTDALLT